jgi:alkanesulfonate monooxygenase SsuD/methylene tetrahydromethanopterin reductase-like flavin-dependent oxidoreductase (luciferase family)
MGNVQFGLIVPADMLDKSRRHLYMDDVNRLLNYVKGHFHSAWLIDHLQSNNSDMLEGWTTLTYLSALHPELQWGHTVICQSFRNPALLAKMAATLKFMSGGRYTLGIGAGWNEEEYLAYGYDFSPPGTRVEELDEALHIIKAMWTQERTTFQGKHYRVIDAYCEPRPDPMPIIMVGRSSPRCCV